MNNATHTTNPSTRRLSTPEASAEIRKALKSTGIKARDVSVRSDCYSMGSTIRIIVKSANVSIAKVEEIATRFARVARDESSGEILSGGNRFVDVEYADDLVDARAQMIEVSLHDDGRVSIFGGWHAFRSEGGAYAEAWRAVRVSDPRNELYCVGKSHFARRLARELLDDGAALSTEAA